MSLSNKIIHGFSFDTDDYDGTKALDIVGASQGILKGTNDLTAQTGGVRGQFQAVRGSNVVHQPKNLSHPKSFSFWLRAGSNSQFMFRFAFTVGSLFITLGYNSGAAGGIKDMRVYGVSVSGGGNDRDLGFDNAKIKNNLWHLIVVSDGKVYIDNDEILSPPYNADSGQIASGNTGTSNNGGWGGWGPTSFNPTNFDVDEFYFFNDFLTSGERDELWNGGDGAFYPFSASSDNIAKINGIPIANIAKIDGVTKANIAKVSGVDL